MELGKVKTEEERPREVGREERRRRDRKGRGRWGEKRGGEGTGKSRGYHYLNLPMGSHAPDMMYLESGVKDPSRERPLLLTCPWNETQLV